MASPPDVSPAQDPTDEEVVRRVLTGETALYEILMRRYNQRLYRAAVSILGDAAEAEDLVQDANVRAFLHLNQFSGAAKFSTWLTRIAVHEALARSQKKRREVQMSADIKATDFSAKDLSPEMKASHEEARRVLESCIQALPVAYRSVFVLREIEGLSTAETASCLDINEEVVKVRLHRSRRMLRKELYTRSQIASASAFQFLGVSCDAVVRAVLKRIAGFKTAPNRIPPSTSQLH